MKFKFMETCLATIFLLWSSIKGIGIKKTFEYILLFFQTFFFLETFRESVKKNLCLLIKNILIISLLFESKMAFVNYLLLIFEI